MVCIAHCSRQNQTLRQNLSAKTQAPKRKSQSRLLHCATPPCALAQHLTARCCCCCCLSLTSPQKTRKESWLERSRSTTSTTSPHLKTTQTTQQATKPIQLHWCCTVQTLHSPRLHNKSAASDQYRIGKGVPPPPPVCVWQKSWWRDPPGRRLDDLRGGPFSGAS